MDNFSDFYDQKIDKIFNYCYYKTGNRFVAEDLTSISFLKFFKSNWHNLQNPVAYIYKICKNEIANYYRGKEKTISLDELLANGMEPGQNYDFEKKILIDQTISEINKLPTDQKDALLLQYVQDLDNKTISEILGKSESAIKSLAHRGLTAIRENFNQKEENGKP